MHEGCNYGLPEALEASGKSQPAIAIVAGANSKSAVLYLVEGLHEHDDVDAGAAAETIPRCAVRACYDWCRAVCSVNKGCSLVWYLSQFVNQRAVLM
jgi:hypothetical protein